MSELTNLEPNTRTQNYRQPLCVTIVQTIIQCPRLGNYRRVCRHTHELLSGSEPDPDPKPAQLETPLICVIARVKSAAVWRRAQVLAGKFPGETSGSPQPVT